MNYASCIYALDDSSLVCNKCNNRIIKNSILFITPCWHYLCGSCINKFINWHNICPICNKNIKDIKINMDECDNLELLRIYKMYDYTSEYTGDPNKKVDVLNSSILLNMTFDFDAVPKDCVKIVGWDDDDNSCDLGWKWIYKQCELTMEIHLPSLNRIDICIRKNVYDYTFRISINISNCKYNRSTVYLLFQKCHDKDDNLRALADIVIIMDINRRFSWVCSTITGDKKLNCRYSKKQNCIIL